MPKPSISNNNKIRILHFTYALQGGGAERQLRNLVNSLDTDQFTNAICCADLAGAEQFSEQIALLKVPRKSKFDLRWSSIYQLISKWKPDIIHNWLPLVLWSSLVPARLQRVIYVGSYRNVYRVNNVTRLLQAGGFIFTKTIVSNVHKQEQVLPFSRIFQMKSGQFIPNGIDLTKINASKAVEIRKLDSDMPLLPTILYAGRLSAHKNIEVILNAIARLKNKSIEFRLLICGDGNDESRLRRLVIAMGLEKQVEFLGYCTNIYTIMSNCDVFILPSLWEGMPNVLFEAMASNIPVIASDIPVHRRWITNGIEGLLFDPKDSEQLAMCLIQIQEESVGERNERLKKARHCVEGLNLDRMVSTYEDFYTNLIHESTEKVQLLPVKA